MRGTGGWETFKNKVSCEREWIGWSGSTSMVCFSIWYLQYSARLCKQTYSFVWKSLPKVVCVPKLFCLLVYSLCFEYCRCLFTYLQLSRCYVYWFVRLRLRALPRHNYLQPIRKVWKMSKHSKCEYIKPNTEPWQWHCFGLFFTTDPTCFWTLFMRNQLRRQPCASFPSFLLEKCETITRTLEPTQLVHIDYDLSCFRTQS